jgi:hypothetical protein
LASAASPAARAVPTEADVARAILRGFGDAALPALPSVSAAPLDAFAPSGRPPGAPSVAALLARSDAPPIKVPDDVAAAFTDWQTIVRAVDGLAALPLRPLAEAGPPARGGGRPADPDGVVVRFEDIRRSADLGPLVGAVFRRPAAAVAAFKRARPPAPGRAKVEPPVPDHSGEEVERLVPGIGGEEEECVCEVPDDVVRAFTDAVRPKEAPPGLAELRVGGLRGFQRRQFV